MKSSFILSKLRRCQQTNPNISSFKPKIFASGAKRAITQASSAQFSFAPNFNGLIKQQAITCQVLLIYIMFTWALDVVIILELFSVSLIVTAVSKGVCLN